MGVGRGGHLVHLAAPLVCGRGLLSFRTSCMHDGCLLLRCLFPNTGAWRSFESFNGCLLDDDHALVLCAMSKSMFVQASGHMTIASMRQLTLLGRILLLSVAIVQPQSFQACSPSASFLPFPISRPFSILDSSRDLVRSTDAEFRFSECPYGQCPFPSTNNPPFPLFTDPSPPKLMTMFALE